ncbi:MAG: glycosyltransferase, partial [Chloroflexota bacterium]
MGRHRDPGHTTDSGQAPLKVSVVVPVYNPGRAIEPCIASVLGQSLPRHDYEVLFVDDGSTDETPARLDELVAREPNVRVIHIPNSGWPGRPRNVGIEAARGDYVQFLDNDDALGREALERLYAIGRRNDADIVIGKVASDFRGVPQGVFRRTRESCTIRDAPLIDSLTPHKMFRTAFLREHEIRFPEGRRRLEDQLFMVRAYFAAAAVSILGDYVCYFYRKRQDGSNAGSARIDPDGYYANLREVLDVVRDNTEPGELRDRLLRRFYRVEILGRLSEPGYLRHEADYRAALFAAARAIALESMSADLDATLAPLATVRATCLRADRPDLLLELCRRLAMVSATASLEAVTWRRGRLHVSLRAGFVTGDPGTSFSPLRLVRDGDRLTLALAHAIGDGPVDVTAEASKLHVEVLLHDRATSVEWLVGSRSTAELVDDVDGTHAVVGATTKVNPLRVVGSAALERGTWDVVVRVAGFGIDRRTRVTAEPSVALVPGLVGVPPTVVVPLRGNGPFAIDVDRAATTLAASLDPAEVVFAPTAGRALQASLPIATTPESGRGDVVLVLGQGPAEQVWHSTLAPARKRVVLDA